MDINIYHVIYITRLSFIAKQSIMTVTHNIKISSKNFKFHDNFTELRKICMGSSMLFSLWLCKGWTCQSSLFHLYEILNCTWYHNGNLVKYALIHSPTESHHNHPFKLLYYTVLWAWRHVKKHEQTNDQGLLARSRLPHYWKLWAANGTKELWDECVMVACLMWIFPWPFAFQL